MEHKTVFKEKAVAHLQINKGNCVVDMTLGAAGHSIEILSKLGLEGTLVTFDLDETAVSNFRQVLEKQNFEIEKKEKKAFSYKKKNLRVHIVNDNFVQIDSYLKSTDLKPDCYLVDLGWSTDQLETIEGLSIGRDENLDMRFDKNLQTKASDLLNILNTKQLVDLFIEYSDISFADSKKLAEEIAKFRKNTAINSSADLLKIIDSAFPVAKSNKTKSFQARIFQALRIAVNMEISNLKSLMKFFETKTASGARIVVITFHSGEQEVVEATFKKLIATGKAESLIKNQNEIFERPSVEDLIENLKSRSAKLWAVKIL